MNGAGGTSRMMLRIREVADRLGVDVRTVWRLIAAKKLPQPVHVSSRSVRIPADEFDAYIERIKRERGQ